VEADDLGEASVEEDDPGTGERFVLGAPVPAGELAALLQTVAGGELTVAARLARPQ
jgi:hypothetical protein